MKIGKLKDIVYNILQESKEARKDDFILYREVLKRIKFNCSMSLDVFLSNAKMNKAPAMESVSRARRKFFEIYPELQNVKTKLAREEKEREFIEFSRN